MYNVRRKRKTNIEQKNEIIFTHIKIEKHMTQ